MVEVYYIYECNIIKIQKRNAVDELITTRSKNVKYALNGTRFAINMDRHLEQYNYFKCVTRNPSDL